jgi:hypothetical protein
MREKSITAEKVAEHARMQSLPKHFGARLMLSVEQTVYHTLRELSAEYRGGYWHYYELSNGGFYMAPDLERLQLCVAGNGFEERLTGDAAGITACLFAYSHLFAVHKEAVLVEHYEWLRAFAVEHAEGGNILAAID